MISIILNEMNSENYKNLINILIKKLKNFGLNLKKTFRMTLIDINFNENIKFNQNAGVIYFKYLKKYYKYKIKYLDLKNTL